MTAQDINGLFDSARAGDSEAEGRLVEHLSQRFGYFARQRIWNADDAKEVAQSAMLIVCREYKTLTVNSSFAAWSYKVLDNLIVEYFRSTHRRNQRIRPDVDLDAIPESSVADDSVRLQLLRCLRMIGTINRSYVRALNYRFQGYAVPDICRRLNLKERALYYLLHRCRTMLRRCLKTGKVT